jgi:tetratricopeptide (TPR) repeat protein
VFLDSAILQCYQILGLKAGASLDAIKEAYHDLVQVWHPDRFEYNPQLQKKAQDTLKSINWAYETLLDSLTKVRAEKDCDRTSRPQQETSQGSYQGSAKNKKAYNPYKKRRASNERDFEKTDFYRWNAEREKRAASHDPSTIGEVLKKKSRPIIPMVAMIICALLVLAFDKSSNIISKYALLESGAGQDANRGLKIVPPSDMAHIPRNAQSADTEFSSLKWLSKELALQMRGDWKGLLQHCRRWVNAEPLDQKGWFSLGIAYDQLGQPTKAVEAYQEALRLDPADSRAWYNLGTSYGKDLHQYTKAIGALLEAVRLRSGYTNALNNLGMAYALSGKQAEARTVYQMLNELDPIRAEKYFQDVILPSEKDQTGQSWTPLWAGQEAM